MEKKSMARLNRNSGTLCIRQCKACTLAFPHKAFPHGRAFSPYMYLGETSGTIRWVPHKASRKLSLAVMLLHLRITCCCARRALLLSFHFFAWSVSAVFGILHFRCSREIEPLAPTYHTAAVLDSAFRAFNSAIIETMFRKLAVKRGTRFSI